MSPDDLFRCAAAAVMAAALGWIVGDLALFLRREAKAARERRRGR